jgi:two-component system response regulator YesN
MQLIHKITSLIDSSGSSGRISPGNRRYCDRAKTFISENIDRKLTVSDVAAAVGVSKNYLTNVFSAGEGIPLMEYINRRKLSYMIELIRRYHYTLSQAGEHVGFTDANYVSRIFKRYYGMTLTEYRRNKLQIEGESIPPFSEEKKYDRN